MADQAVIVEEEANTGFVRGLGLWDSTMIVAGSMIGSGIFLVAADIARTVGSAGLIITVWLVTGVLTIAGALAYGELASMMPRSGGVYVYLKEAFSPLLGFLYGWTLFAVIQSGSLAAVAVAFAKYLGVLVPSVSPTSYLIEPINISHDYALSLSTQQLFAILLLIVLTFINTRGLRLGKIIQNVFTSAKTVAVILLILLCVFVGWNADAVARNFTDIWTPRMPIGIEPGVSFAPAVSAASGVVGLFVAFCVAQVGSIFAADGWYYITFTAGEVKNPRRTIPVSLVAGTALVIALYILASVAYMVTLPIESDVAKLEAVKQAEVLRTGSNAAQSAEDQAAIAQAELYKRELEARYKQDIDSLDQSEEFRKNPLALGIQQADDDRVATAALNVTLGAIGAALMAIAIMISTFGCNNGLILAGARVFYTMARDGLFFKATGKLNSKHVPAVSLILQCVWSCFLVLPRTRLYDESGQLQRADDGTLLYGNLYGNLLDYVVAAILVFFILVIVGVFVLRRKRPDAERPYTTFGYPVIPALYILAAATILGVLILYRTQTTWPGLLIVLSGVPVYLIWRRRAVG
jgi:basic amino acid/polyamine antiporter, APA family